MTKNIKIEIPIEKLGYPGSSNDWSILLNTEDENRSDKQRLYDTKDRQFRLIGFLSSDTIKKDDFSFNLDEDIGSSLVKVVPHLKRIDLEANGINYSIFKNVNNELSKFEFHCINNSINGALASFNSATIPLIDHLSFISNVPIMVDKIIGQDIENNILFTSYDVPYAHFIFDEKKYNIGFVHEFMRPVYALYREAKNSHSKYYRFLCYYKILEGIYKIIRPETYKKAKSKGIKVKLQREVVPANDHLNENHIKYIGKPIKEIFDSYFKNKFRHSIAHFTKKDGSPFILSDFYTQIQVTSIITLIEICCRVVIDNQISLLNQIRN